MSRPRRIIPPVLLAIVILALVGTGIRPYDRLTWLLEVFWVILGIPLVLLTWRRFPLTTLLCALLAISARAMAADANPSPRMIRFQSRR